MTMIGYSHRISRDAFARLGAIVPPAKPAKPAKPTAARQPEDESADPVGDGHADADLAADLPPVPGRPNPEPDLPSPTPADEGEMPDENDDELRLSPSPSGRG